MSANAATPWVRVSVGSQLVRTTLVFWWLAVKRSGGLLLLPVVAGLIMWLVDNRQREGIVLWDLTLQGIGYSVVIVGPLMAAFACWVAGRSRRRGMTGLVTTAALPERWPALADCAGVVCWGLAVFLGSAGLALFWTATEATWGRPALAPLVIAAVATVVCGVLGVLVGRRSASRFLPPLLAIAVVALFLAPIGLSQLEAFQMLSPMGAVNLLTREPLYVVDEAVVLPHLRWLVTLGAVLVLMLVAWPARTWLARGVLVAGGLAAAVAASSLAGFPVPIAFSSDSRLAPYELTCATDTVAVCVHPAYEALLDDVAAEIDTLVQPVVGLEGIPTRYEQDVGRLHLEGNSGRFYLWDEASLGHLIPFTLVMDLVVHPALPAGQRVAGPPGTASYVVGEWLVRRVGGDQADESGAMPVEIFDLLPEVAPLRCDETGCAPDESQYRALRQEFDAAVARFSALDPATRRAWLEANWADLRAGRLTMEDLP